MHSDPEATARQMAEAQALAHIGYWELEVFSGVSSWSTELYRILGLPQDSPAGTREFLGRVPPEDRDTVQRIITESLRPPYPTVEYECRITRPDGEIRFLRNRHRVSVDSHGEAIRMMGTLLDISDSRRAEQALAESERHHRELIENASDLITVIGTDGIVTYSSPSVQRLLGYSPEERLGRSAFDLIHPEDAPGVREAMSRYLTDPSHPFPVEFRLRHRDGSWRAMEALGQARAERSGPYSIVVNARDVTERKLAESRQRTLMADLERALAQAESATRTKSDFLANMSHEIRTPLNAIMGLTELVLDSDVTPDQRRHLDLVRESAEVLLTLLNDILDLSKIEANRLVLESIPVDLRQLVHARARMFAVGAAGTSVELRVEISETTPHLVRTDPTRVGQVITNLLGNAIKFTPSGHVLVSVTAGAISGGIVPVRFLVRDTGIGIPADKLGTLFGDYTQIDGSTTRRYGGTGLGLAISSRLVRLLGGELGVASEVGRGSEFGFTLLLPVESARADADAEEVAPRSHPRPSLAAGRPAVGLRILLAEDNRVNQEVATTMLRKRGHEVVVASNGREAVDEASRQSFDLVLMDLHMPDMDGFAATAAIRRLPDGARLRIIAVTADALTGERERCLARGMDDYLAKPFRPADLFALVEQTTPATPKASPVAPARSATPTTPTSTEPAPVDIEGFREAMRRAGALEAVDGILDTFLADALSREAAVQQALVEGTAAQIQSAAHAFKSAAGAIGARTLAGLLLSIEQAARRGQVADARVHGPALAEEISRVMAQLRHLRGGDSTHA